MIGELTIDQETVQEIDQEEEMIMLVIDGGKMTIRRMRERQEVAQEGKTSVMTVGTRVLTHKRGRGPDQD